MPHRSHNIHNVLDRADEIDLREGLTAYARYRVTMARFAEYYNFPLAPVVAAFVAMSPNNDYKGNLKSLATLLYGVRSGWALDEITVTTYKACRDRAYSFATEAADFLTVTRGPKTRSFYQNILNPDDQAVRLRYRYEDVAHGVREVAFARGFVPCQVQAVCWFTWKRLHNAVYDSQLNLFAGGDQWGSEVEPARVRTFARRSYAAI